MQNFNIIVEPCLVTSIDIVKALSDYYYQVGSGDPNVVTDQYEFIQNPDCQYVVSITANVVPTHINHDPTGQDFTVPATSDLSLIGSYPITVRAELSFPSDHTKTSTTVIDNQFDFTVFLTPCTITDYVDTQKVNTIRYALGEPTL